MPIPLTDEMFNCHFLAPTFFLMALAEEEDVDYAELALCFNIGGI